MIELPECVTRGEVARLIPVTADSNKEQRAASILLAAFRGVHEFQKTMLSSLGMRVGLAELLKDPNVENSETTSVVPAKFEVEGFAEWSTVFAEMKPTCPKCGTHLSVEHMAGAAGA